MSLTRAGVAQLVEQLTCNQQVVGSTPIASSNKFKGLHFGEPCPFCNTLLSNEEPESVELPQPFLCLSKFFDKRGRNH